MADDRNSKIAILGAGASGIAAARLALAGGAAWVGVFDSGDPAGLLAADETLRKAGAETCFGEAALKAPSDLDLVVVSPGIDLRWPIGQAFGQSGAPVIGEIEYAFQHWERPVVAITGTNGKTTTTELTAAVLNAGGLKSVAAGNIGNAFCELVLSGDDLDLVALEVSSFQLETIQAFRPEVAVWTNLAPDHMDRYDSVEDYRQAKLRIFENQTAEDAAVVNAADSLPGLAAQPTTFSAFESGADFGLEDGRICFLGEPILDFSRTRLVGSHNAENIMAAMAAAHCRGVSFDAMTDAVCEFRAAAHRCEVVGEIGGVTYINDSKATNLHALESSLRGRDKAVVLIAGGKNKGLDYRQLRQTVADHVDHAVVIGEMAEAISQAWHGAVSCEIAQDLSAAVAAAARVAKPGQTVLFSPGTSSFDMFTSYAARGDVFRETVQSLSS